MKLLINLIIMSQLGFVEAIVEDKLNYPYTAYAAVMVDSRDNTQVPKRTYEVRGIKCKVPTNYIPMDTLDEKEIEQHQLHTKEILLQA